MVFQGAQWYPVVRLSAPGELPDAVPGCEFSNAPVIVSRGDGEGDRCSRFILQFCTDGWISHPRTRHLAKFECIYPASGDGKVADYAWFHAQTVGASSGHCPAPSDFLWPPSKITYPRCSSTMTRLKVELGWTFASTDAGEVDPVSRLQALSAPHDCPPPSQFRWTPDRILWPDCDEWMRRKCAAGSSCDKAVTAPGAQVSGDAALSFAAAQHWSAGLGKCPPYLEGRWQPGPIFFPRCSEALQLWCNGRDCVNLGRLEGQRSVHYESGACPHPEHGFVWPFDLGALSSGSEVRPRRRKKT